ncbi:MAG TPA: malto-oligosyltrehalose trehalohydrolase [Flavipsychrobacter sp.]|nr:malto-oligosyltrehalose trehalohydrolase [Flavipsychrobacter sp.]
MSQLEVEKRGLGITFAANGDGTITVWAPIKQSISLVVNDKEVIPLSRAGNGYWQTTTDKIKPGDLYEILVNEKETFPDPVSVSQPNGVHGQSQALNLSGFDWTDNNWNNIPLKDYIIYELHTGTFTVDGTFESIEEKLDYLRDLGITAIEIMPVAQFPGPRNWGYDGVFPFAAQNSYGGAEALQHLVNVCHEKGIAVILDAVYNHFGPEGNYLNEFAPYFTDKYRTPWGQAINFDDAYCDGVRRYFIENALMWFRDFHIDGLRLDAVHAIKDFSPKHILKEMKEQVDKLMEATGRTHYLIVECDLNDPRFINPTSENGYGMDAQWIDEFHHALRVATGEQRTGYYADFNGLVHLAKAYTDAYVYDGQYSPYRHKAFGVKTNNPGQQFIVFSQNHDQIGNRMLGQRTSDLVHFEMQKLMVGAVMLAPYLPMLFMGEEYSEPNPFLYFVSHSDPELVAAVRKGRKEEFAAFHIEGEAPDPQSEETFSRSKLQWDLSSKEPYRTMLAYYKALIELRKTHPVLANPERKNLAVRADEQMQTLQLHRWHGDAHILCFMNFSQQVNEVIVPPLQQAWQVIFDSADPKWKGSKAATGSAKDQSVITLQPQSLLVYSNA